MGLPLLLKIVQPLPTQRGLTVAPPCDDGTGLSLDLFLNLAAEAIGITHAHLDLESAGWERIAHVGFAGQCGREDRLLCRAIPIQVVHDPSGGLSQEESGVA